MWSVSMLRSMLRTSTWVLSKWPRLRSRAGLPVRHINRNALARSGGDHCGEGGAVLRWGPTSGDVSCRSRRILNARLRRPGLVPGPMNGLGTARITRSEICLRSRAHALVPPLSLALRANPTLSLNSESCAKRPSQHQPQHQPGQRAGPCTAARPHGAETREKQNHLVDIKRKKSPSKSRATAIPDDRNMPPRSAKTASRLARCQQGVATCKGTEPSQRRDDPEAVWP